ncbi:Hypothetical protein VV1_2013 [Vibrio vulnificus CMCP6]|uniref:Uncharacterized protein n=1 Tax=Vibrio vulnificus (strain CMCP6) TaxID=216895 RepID=A0A3Q0L4N3_VIBVU|nr:Hypothetical protein VV1_2013 [Vibrio vulnificus CMCP6]
MAEEILGAMQQAPQPSLQSILVTCQKSRGAIVAEIYDELNGQFLPLHFEARRSIKRLPSVESKKKSYEHTILAIKNFARDDRARVGVTLRWLRKMLFAQINGRRD